MMTRRMLPLLLLTVAQFLLPSSSFLTGAIARRSSSNCPIMLRSSPNDSSNDSSYDSAAAPLLPVMPLDLGEVLLPGQTRHLHLYEARFLSLLETSQAKCNSEVILGLMHGQGMLKLGVLAKLESTTREQVGAGVDLRAVRAVGIGGLTMSDDLPFMQARCDKYLATPSPDQQEDDEGLLSQVLEAWSSVGSLLSKADLRNQELRVDPRSFDSHVEAPGDDDGDLIMRAKAAAGACKNSINPDPHSVKEYASWLCFEVSWNTRQRQRACIKPSDRFEATLTHPSCYSQQGSGIADKVKALEARGTNERLAVGLSLLRERERVLAAKVAIKSAFDD